MLADPQTPDGLDRGPTRQGSIPGTGDIGPETAIPAYCRSCTAVLRDGPRVWEARPAGAGDTACPACRRIADHRPAGYVHLGGTYFRDRRPDLRRLLFTRQEAMVAQDPLARIISAREDRRGVLITTADMALARELGETLHRAHQGRLECRLDAAREALRERWFR